MKSPIIFSLFVIAGGVVYFYTNLSPIDDEQISVEEATLINPFTQSQHLENINTLEHLASSLKQRYEKDIANIATQALIYNERERFLAKFPQFTQSFFHEALELAFPTYVIDLLSLFDLFDQYFTWLQASETQLAQLAHIQQEAAVWEKRWEIFGDDAELIWPEGNATKQADQLQIALAQIDSAPMSLDEKLYQVSSEFEELVADKTAELEHLGALGVSTQTAIQSVKARSFFSLDSVQNTLNSMDESQRQSKIDELRAQMGFTPEQIADMRKVDEARNSRWQNGLSYMQARDQLMATLDDEGKSQALIELRDKYFGREAQTIEKEEAIGFFRFERPRVYGNN